MKICKYLAAACVVFTLCSAFSFKSSGPKPVYVMGVSISFVDTLVYMTEIQPIQGVRLTYDGFLPQRDDYSYQLKNFLESKDGNRNHTCVTYFSKDKEKLQKKAAMLTKRFMAAKSTVIVSLNQDEFQYVKPEDYYTE